MASYLHDSSTLGFSDELLLKSSVSSLDPHNHIHSTPVVFIRDFRQVETIALVNKIPKK